MELNVKCVNIGFTQSVKISRMKNMRCCQDIQRGKYTGTASEVYVHDSLFRSVSANTVLQLSAILHRLTDCDTIPFTSTNYTK